MGAADSLRRAGTWRAPRWAGAWGAWQKLKQTWSQLKLNVNASEFEHCLRTLAWNCRKSFWFSGVVDNGDKTWQQFIGGSGMLARVCCGRCAFKLVAGRSEICWVWGLYRSPQLAEAGGREYSSMLFLSVWQSFCRSVLRLRMRKCPRGGGLG